MTKTKSDHPLSNPLVNLEYVSRTKKIYPLTEEEIDQLGNVNNNLTWFMWLNSISIGTFVSFLIVILGDDSNNLSWLFFGASALGTLIFSILIISFRKRFSNTLKYIKPDDSNYLKIDMPTEYKGGVEKIRLKRESPRIIQRIEEMEILGRIYVLTALYGTNKNTSDVREITQQLIISSPQFQVGNHLVNGNDPDYGNKKYLWMRYIKNKITIEKTFAEDEFVNNSEL